MLDSLINLISDGDFTEVRNLYHTNRADVDAVLANPESSDFQNIYNHIVQLAQKNKPHAHYIAIILNIKSAIEVTHCKDRLGAIPYLASLGYYEILEYYITETNKVTINQLAMLAAEIDNIPLLKWCFDRKEKPNNAPELAKNAAKNGNISIVQWCLDMQQITINQVAEVAVESNDLILLKWCFHTRRSEKPNNILQLLNTAIKIGDTDTVKYCFRIAKGTKNIEDLAKEAVKYGNVNIIEWCFQNGATNTEEIIEIAIAHKEQKIIECCFKRDTIDPSKFLQCAIINDNTTFIDWCIENDKHALLVKVKEIAECSAKGGHVIALKHCIDKYAQPALPLLTLAIKSEKMEAASALLDSCKDTLTPETFALHAAEIGDLKALQWCVTEKKANLLTNDLATAASKGGHFNIINWCIENGLSQLDSVAEVAAANGRLDILDFCFEHLTMRPTNIQRIAEKAMANAQQGSLYRCFKHYSNEIDANALYAHCEEDSYAAYFAQEYVKSWQNLHRLRVATFVSLAVGALTNGTLLALCTTALPYTASVSVAVVAILGALYSKRSRALYENDPQSNYATTVNQG